MVRLVFTWAYRIIFAMAGFALVVISALIDRKVVGWAPVVGVYVAFGVGLLAFLDNLRLLRFKFQAHERGAARARMHKPLVNALDSITDCRPIRMTMLGISVFVIKRKWVLKCRFVPWYEKRLRRLLRFRLSDYPAESRVDWSIGKGTIGECWATGEPVLHDRRSTAARYGKGHHPNEQEYAALSEEEHCSFSLPEFNQTIDKYGEILAVPIVAKHSGEQIGVLSIDCLAEAYAGESSPPILAGDEVEVFAGRAAFYIRDDVAKF